MINNPGAKALVEKLPLLHAQNFIDDNGAQIENYEILALIHKVMNEGKINVSFLLPVPDQPLNELYYSLQDEARNLVDM